MASFHAIGRALTFGAIGPSKVDPNKPLSPFAQAMNAQNGKAPAPPVSAPAPTNAGSIAAGPQPPDAVRAASDAAKAGTAAATKQRRRVGGLASKPFGGALAAAKLQTPTLSGY